MKRDDWWLLIPRCMCPNGYYNHKTRRTKCELPGNNFGKSCNYDGCEMVHIIPPKPEGEK
jgi:hypothetical protein